MHRRIKAVSWTLQGPGPRNGAKTLAKSAGEAAIFFLAQLGWSMEKDTVVPPEAVLETMRAFKQAFGGAFPPMATADMTSMVAHAQTRRVGKVAQAGKSRRDLRALKTSQVHEIRALIGKGLPDKVIAKKLGLPSPGGRASVWRIRNGKTYREVV